MSEHRQQSAGRATHRLSAEINSATGLSSFEAKVAANAAILNTRERKIRDEILAAASTESEFSLNDPAHSAAGTSGGSKKTIARRIRSMAVKKRQRSNKLKPMPTSEKCTRDVAASKDAKDSRMNPGPSVKNAKRKSDKLKIGKKAEQSLHEFIENHWKEKIRRLQPTKGVLPLFIKEDTKDLELIRMKQEESSATALKCKFTKRTIPCTTTSANNVHTETAPLKSAPVATTQPVIEQIRRQVSGEKLSKTNAYISHFDRPDKFYLRIPSTIAALQKLQGEIQIVAPSLPQLEEFSTGARCIVWYSVDEQWHRAAITGSGSGITSILFIDHGNTCTINDKRLIKSMNDAFDQIPPYAIPCSLPLEVKDRMEWSEKACELLRNLVDKRLRFELVCKGMSNNFVKLYHGGVNIMQQLIEDGHAIKLEYIESGTDCYVSHINSMCDFYIQMESDAKALETVADYLLDVSKFDIKEGAVCAAKYSEDQLWYRAKILSRKEHSTEVFFVDYGNSSLTNDLRIIPSELATSPSLARYCSMVKPKGIQYWSERAERRFSELTEMELLS